MKTISVALAFVAVAGTLAAVEPAFAQSPGEGQARAVDARTSEAVEGWGGNPRYGIYRTRDGRYLTVSLLEKKFWDAFCRLHGREDLINPHETEADRLTTHAERILRDVTNSHRAMSADLRAAARNEPLVNGEERGEDEQGEPREAGARRRRPAAGRDNPFVDLEPPSWVEN